MKGYKIEEISAPWDLYLEGHYLGSPIGLPEHIAWVTEGQERIFSIRTSDREPIADIVCMPLINKRYDVYWPKLRILKTNTPMTIDEKNLIVLDVIASNYKKPSKELLTLVEKFFVKNGGILNNDCPLGLTFKNHREVRKWQKSCRNYISWNLCISSTVAFIKECQVQPFGLEEAIRTLKSSVFDDVYVNVDDQWMGKVMDYLEAHPVDRQRRVFYVFSPSNNQEQMNKFIQRYKSWTI